MAGVPVFRLAGAVAVSTTANTVVWPTHATNDVALLLIQADAQVTALSTSAGFVVVSNSGQITGTAAATNAISLDVYWCRATSAAQASPVISDAGDHTVAQIITFTNCATTGNPWTITTGSILATAATAVAVTGATTTVANCLIVAIVANSVDSATAQTTNWANANLTSLAEITDFNTTTGGGGGIGVGAGGLVTPGATGTTTANLAAVSKQAKMMIALRPDTNITGTGSLAVPIPTLAATGTNVYAFAKARQGIITGLDSAQAEADGWDARVKAAMAVGAVVRTSDTVVTIIVSAFASYNITAQETITVTVPASALAGGVAITGTPTFTIDLAVVNTTGSGSVAVAVPTLAGTGLVLNPVTGTGSLAVSIPALAGAGKQFHSGSGSLGVVLALAGAGQQFHTGTGSLALEPSLSGSGTVGGAAITGTGSLAVAMPALAGSGQQQHTGTGSLAVTVPVLAGTGTANFASIRGLIILGLDSAQSEATGWDAEVKAKLLPGAVVRTSDTVVTITVSAAASYNITAQETITVTIPASALVGGVAIVATPTFTVDAVTVAGTGSLAVAPALAGTGTVTNLVITGTGSLAVAIPTLAGTGTVITPITGTGSMAVPLPSYAFGDTLRVPIPTLSGTGTVGVLTVTGTGSMAVAIPTFSGTGKQQHTGTGSLAITIPSLAASGQQQHTSTGSLVVAVPSFVGTGQQSHTGTGSVAVVLELSGTGTTSSAAITGTGDLTLTVILSGAGTHTAPVGTLTPGGGGRGRSGPRRTTRYGRSAWELEHDEQAARVAEPETPIALGPPEPADPRLGKPARLVPVEAPPLVLPPVPEVRTSVPTESMWVRPDDESDDEEAILLLLEQL